MSSRKLRELLLTSSKKTKTANEQIECEVMSFLRSKNLLTTKEFTNYSSYLASDWWKTKRSEVREKFGSNCELCGDLGTINVHHNNYSCKGNETDDDLIILCRYCHISFHEKVSANVLAERKRFNSLYRRKFKKQCMLCSNMDVYVRCPTIYNTGKRKINICEDCTELFKWELFHNKEIEILKGAIAGRSKEGYTKDAQKILHLRIKYNKS